MLNSLSKFSKREKSPTANVEVVHLPKELLLDLAVILQVVHLIKLVTISIIQIAIIKIGTETKTNQKIKTKIRIKIKTKTNLTPKRNSRLTGLKLPSSVLNVR